MSETRPRPVAWLLLAAVLSTALLLRAANPPHLGAQTISVTVLDGQTSQPVQGAIVALSTDGGSLLARRLTDERGRVLFFREGIGLQRIRVEMIGMASAETEAFQVDHRSTVHRDLTLATNPIPIRGLAVDGDSRCRVDPAAGEVTARLWDEARKALIAAAIADEQDLYRYDIMLYEQDLDRTSLVVERSRQTRRHAAMETPFVSRPVEDLMRYGYVERSGAVDLYMAPDAHVLLSDAFLGSHCFGFRVGRHGGEAEGLVGLTFEPTSDRRRFVEVAGTLWLDPSTSELQWLEYDYVNLDPDLRLPEVGGRVEFQRMPDGGWIVPEWFIKMPSLGLQRSLDGSSRRTYVRGFRETGGRVLDVQAPGRVIGHAMAGAMEGVVRDSVGSPMEGVRVELVGTEWTAETDSAGSFSFYPLVDGVYQVRLAHPTLERFGQSPVEFTRVVVDGETTLVESRVPTVRSTVLEACRADGVHSDSVPLIGLVRRSDGTRASDAEVRVVWDRGSDGYVVHPGELGVFTLCNVPRDKEITVFATSVSEPSRGGVPEETGDTADGPHHEAAEVTLEAAEVTLPAAVDSLEALTTEVRLVAADDGEPFGVAGQADAPSADGLPSTARMWLDSLGYDLRRATALYQVEGDELAAYDSLPEIFDAIPRVEYRRSPAGVGQLLLHQDTAWVTGADQGCPLSGYVNGGEIRQREFGTNQRALPALFDLNAITALEVFDGARAPVGPADGCGVVLVWIEELRETFDPPFLGTIRGRIEGLADGDHDDVTVTLAPFERSAEVDADGRFDMGAVPPGRYTVEARLPGVGVWLMPVEARAGAAAEVSIEVARR